eukprot:5910355-Ditylum_brightwellii.AAC.2
MICLIDNMGKVKLSEIKQYITKVKSTADKYALQNLIWSGTYLLNSISNVLPRKALQKVSITFTGLEILVAIVVSFGTFTFDSMKQLKTRENIVNMNQHIKALCDRLWGTGYWDKNLFYYIVNKYLQSSCEVFWVWAITHVSEKTTTYLNAAINFHENNIDEFTIVTYTQLLDDTSYKYEEMLWSGM